MKFPYWKNYIELTKLEWHSFIGCHDHKDHKVLFIGGGPLPLTAIVLATIHKVRSTIVEVDQDAVELSRDLISVLGLSDMIKIEHSSAEEFGRYSKYNTIFIAALAGLEPENKIKILEKIKSESAEGSHILARSSYGGRRLLYMPLSDQVSKLFKPILEVRPLNDIVNSVLIFQN